MGGKDVSQSCSAAASTTALHWVAPPPQKYGVDIPFRPLTCMNFLSPLFVWVQSGYQGGGGAARQQQQQQQQGGGTGGGGYQAYH